MRMQTFGGTASAHRVAGTTNVLVPDTPDDGCSLSLSLALVDATAGSSGEEGLFSNWPLDVCWRILQQHTTHITEITTCTYMQVNKQQPEELNLLPRK
jgi:hypothetical protein